MPIECLDLIALLLAPRALVDAWLHPGLFEELRDWLTVWASPAIDDEQETPRRRWQAWFGSLFAFGINCAFCLSYHAAFWLLLLMYAVLLWFPPALAGIGRFILYWLALTQVSTLLLRGTEYGQNTEAL